MSENKFEAIWAELQKLNDEQMDTEDECAKDEEQRIDWNVRHATLGEVYQVMKKLEKLF